MHNTTSYHVAQAFLAKNADRLSVQLIKDAQSQKVELVPQVFEIKKNIKGASGAINLIDATTQKVVGISSFSQNRLETGRAGVVSHISIGYKTDAATGKEGALAYTVALPAALQNATLLINQNGKEILRLPAIEVSNLTAGQRAADQYTELKSLLLLDDNNEIELKLEFPTGVAMPTDAEQYIYLRMSGFQTVRKS